MDLLRPFRGGWDGVAMMAPSPAPAIASVDANTVRWRFDWEWCFDPDNGAEGDTSWWWARSVRVDPNEVIADDGEGHLWSVPFSTDGTDTITWGEPQRVAETFVPVAAAEGAMATEVVRRRRQRVAASFAERPDKSTRPDQPNPAASAATTEQEESTVMDVDTTLLRRRLGLPDDATEEQIQQALAAEPPETEERVPGSEEEQPAEPTAETRELEPAAAAVRETLGLPASATDEQVAQAARELRDGARAGAQEARHRQTTELDGLVDAAVQDGRIAPSARGAWRQAIDPGESPSAAATARADQERAALAALPTNRVPVTARGAAPSTDKNSGSLGRALAASGLSRREAPKEGEVIRRG
jgi:hypothetical protein